LTLAIPGESLGMRVQDVTDSELPLEGDVLEEDGWDLDDFV
jgi:hypothetical protein